MKDLQNLGSDSVKICRKICKKDLLEKVFVKV